MASRELSKNDANNNWQILGNAYAELDFLKHFILGSSFGGAFNFYNNYNYAYGRYDPALGMTNSQRTPVIHGRGHGPIP